MYTIYDVQLNLDANRTRQFLYLFVLIIYSANTLTLFIRFEKMSE